MKRLDAARSDHERDREEEQSAAESRKNKYDLLQKAKKAVMDKFKFTEPEAHRYVQKCAMDSGTDIAEVCEMFILLYG